MSIAEEIVKWVSSGKPYDKGQDIYSRYGSNPHLNRRFMRGPNDYNTEKLYLELMKIFNRQPNTQPVKKMSQRKVVSLQVKKAPLPKAVNIPTQEFIRHTISKFEKMDVSKLSPELQAEFIRKGTLFREMAKLSRELDEMKSDADRFEAAKKIIDSSDEIARIWHKCDEYLKGNVSKVIEDKCPEDMTLEELIKHRNNCRSYITKYQDNPKKGPIVAEKIKTRDLCIGLINKLNGKQIS